MGIFSVYLSHSTDTAQEAITLNDARVHEAINAGFNLIRLTLPTDDWFTSVPLESKKTRLLQIVSGTIGAALSNGIRIVVVPIVPAKVIVCEGTNRQAYGHVVDDLLNIFPNVELLGFEFMNEPPSCPGDGIRYNKWSSVEQEFYLKVRHKLPRIFIVITGPKWGSIDGLLDFDPRPYASDFATLFTFHYYEPILYTHQQIPWIRTDGLNQYVDGLAWPVEIDNLHRTLRNAIASIELLGNPISTDGARRKSLRDLFDDYNSSGRRDHIGDRFRLVADWGVRNGVAPNRIFLGEFGVHRKVTSEKVAGPPWPSARLWLGAVRREAERRNFGWSVWDLDSGFGVMCDEGGSLPKLCSDYIGAL